jgi:hypothetical protein
MKNIFIFYSITSNASEILTKEDPIEYLSNYPHTSEQKLRINVKAIIKK